MRKRNPKSGFAMIAAIFAALIPVIIIIGLVIYTMTKGPQEDSTATSQSR